MIASISLARCLTGATFWALVVGGSGQANIFNRRTSSSSERLQEGDTAGSLAGGSGSESNIVRYARLSRNASIPMVGFGVGNLPPDFVSEVVAEAIQDDKRTYLIETAHNSNNEHLVAEGILNGMKRLGKPDGTLQVHVITKIWYTHLGYDRTRLAVKDIIDAFKPVLESREVDLKLHILLHWPRCYDSIPMMDCEGDEFSLPKHVREAGADPRTNPDAWKDSWRMLEDYFLAEDKPIESIGVANFLLSDLQELTTFARVYPHILQTSLWSLMHDAPLVSFCHGQSIHLQAFNVFQSTMWKPEAAPRAFHHIQMVTSELSRQSNGSFTPAQTILAWLVQLDVSVVPRTSVMSHLAENSAAAISVVPTLTDQQVDVVANAVEAYLTGMDMAHDAPISITFEVTNRATLIYWLGAIDEIRLAHVSAGHAFNETTYAGHVYRLYDAQDRDTFVDYHIDASEGCHQTIHVDLLHQIVEQEDFALPHRAPWVGLETF